MRLPVNAKERNFPHSKRQRLFQGIDARIEASRKECEYGDHKDNQARTVGYIIFLCSKELL